MTEQQTPLGDGKVATKPTKARIEDDTLHLSTKRGSEQLSLSRNTLNYLESLGYRRLDRDNIINKQDHPYVPTNVSVNDLPYIKSLELYFYKPENSQNKDTKMLNYMIPLYGCRGVMDSIYQLYPEWAEYGLMIRVPLIGVQERREVVRFVYDLSQAKVIHHIEHSVDDFFGDTL